MKYQGWLILAVNPVTVLTLHSSEQKNIPKLLLNQLRWLDVIEDSAVLNEKLIECLNMPLSSDIKREVIITIPDIIEDEQHEARFLTTK